MTISRTLLLATLFLMGCSQENPGHPPEQAQIPAVTTSQNTESHVDAEAPSNNDSAVFDVQPAVFRSCDATKITTVVAATWHTTALGVKNVQIFVQSPGTERKLWLEGGASGSEHTGNWVFDKTTLTLVDKVSGHTIAEREIRAMSCQ